MLEVRSQAGRAAAEGGAVTSDQAMNCYVCNRLHITGGRCSQHGETVRYHYVLRNGMLFESGAGRWLRILSLCLDDPEQGPVVTLPIFSVGKASPRHTTA